MEKTKAALVKIPNSAIFSYASREEICMIRVVLRWINSPWAFELVPGLNRLGRNPTNDFRISDPSVSSFHAELTVGDEVIRVRDLGSTNGTFIDERRVEEGTLGPNQILRLGNIRFALDEVLVTPISPPESAPGAVPQTEAPACIYHAETRAEFKCENCAATLCNSCIGIMGQGKYEPTTLCPVCKGQCHPLPQPIQPPGDQPRSSILRRLTQTLRVPFSR